MASPTSDLIICNSFEVMKSYIIILSIDCNAHLHNLIKKQKHFRMLSFSVKTKGGARYQVRQNKFFWADRNFWLMRWPGLVESQNLAGWEIFIVDTLLAFLCGLKSDWGGDTTKICLYFKREFWLYPPPVTTSRGGGGRRVRLKLHRKGKGFSI